MILLKRKVRKEDIWQLSFLRRGDGHLNPGFWLKDLVRFEPGGVKVRISSFRVRAYCSAETLKDAFISDLSPPGTRCPGFRITNGAGPFKKPVDSKQSKSGGKSICAEILLLSPRPKKKTMENGEARLRWIPHSHFCLKRMLLAGCKCSSKPNTYRSIRWRKMTFFPALHGNTLEEIWIFSTGKLPFLPGKRCCGDKNPPAGWTVKCGNEINRLKQTWFRPPPESDSSRKKRFELIYTQRQTVKTIWGSNLPAKKLKWDGVMD